MKNIQNFVVPKNKFALFKLLYTGKLKLNPLWEKWPYRLKFVMRAITISPKTLNLLDHLTSYPMLGYFLSRQTNLPCKLQRPYLAACFNSKKCLEALVYHYDFFTAKNAKLTHACYGNEPYLLAKIEGKNEQTFTLLIQSEDKYSREGELTIFMYDSNNAQLATLTFSIIEYADKSTLFIAGLQGATGNDAKQRIQQATKACYGSFPKRIVLETALNLAQALNIEQIIAVGNKTHIYNNWRYKSRFEQLHSDYDEFWLTLDAQKNEQNLYLIPLEIARKPIEEIASKKRSEYRNRYALLDKLSIDVKNALVELK